MRITTLNLKNFKCFEDREFTFLPGFNLVVGRNASGKTTVLDALAVASGAWLLGLSRYSKYCKARSIYPEEVRLVALEKERRIRYERHFPVAVQAGGTIAGRDLDWKRTLEGINGRTTSRDASDLKQFGQKMGTRAMRGDKVTLPLVSYYGTGRVWQQPRDLKSRRVSSATKAATSVFHGYLNSHDPRASAADLFRWIQTQQFIALEEGRSSVELRVLKQAVLGCLEGGKKMYFSVKMADLVVEIEEHGRQPYNNLSDGYRNMIAMIGDIAFKAVTLNPHLGIKAAAETPGLVLIDELDLHLHPKWQRRVIDDLKRTFPAMQFICTSHSPFLIQALKPGELVMLDPPAKKATEEDAEYAGRPIEDIVEDIQDILEPQRPRRAVEMAKATEKYFGLLEETGKAKPAELAKAEREYREVSELYSTEPGLSAVLKLRAMAAETGSAKK